MRNQKNRALCIGRAALGLSQYQVAHLAGLSTNRYWRIENGWAEATPDEREAIARVLQVEPSAAFPETAAAS